MSKVPISIRKIKSDRLEYEFTIQQPGSKWLQTYHCSFNDLMKFKENIDGLINETNTADKLNVSEEDAAHIDSLHLSDLLCKSCNFKMSKDCITCALLLQSPLERKVFIELKKNYIGFNAQYGLDWNGNYINTKGKSYENPQNNFKNVLTIADFFIEKRDKKICIYTDGHHYHERTEEQATHDKKIDRKLQELGFTVLRYTGKEVNENIEGIVTDIKKHSGF